MYEFAILDTEFTAWKGSLERGWSLNWERREIINMAAIKFNNFSNVNIRSFDILCKTNKVKPLPIYIQKLTKISENKINSLGKTFPIGLKKITRFFSDVKIIYVIGWDKKIIIENCKSHKLINPSFINKVVDIRPVISTFLKKNEKEVISSELSKLKSNNKFKPHTALYDCFSIFYLIKKNINDENIKNFLKLN